MDAAGKILVLLSTFNGGERLRTVLEAYSKLEGPSCAWAMIVVDNASTDRTPEMLASFANRLPLTILHEPQPGKNGALNRAVAHSKLDADLFIFTDDDAVPDQGFLVAWEKAMWAFPDESLLGGWIEPRFPAEPEPWLKRLEAHYPMLFAQRRGHEGPVTAIWIFGPNMAVRRAVFEAGFRFNPQIGPNSSDAAYPMGSESEFLLRVEREAGVRSRLIAGARVGHIIRPEQMTRQWVEGRAFRHGRGRALRAKAQGSLDLEPGLLSAFGPVRPFAHKLAWQLLKREKSWWQYHWVSGYRRGLREMKRGGFKAPPLMQ